MRGRPRDFQSLRLKKQMTKTYTRSSKLTQEAKTLHFTHKNNDRVKYVVTPVS